MEAHEEVLEISEVLARTFGGSRPRRRTRRRPSTSCSRVMRRPASPPDSDFAVSRACVRRRRASGPIAASAGARAQTVVTAVSTQLRVPSSLQSSVGSPWPRSTIPGQPRPFDIRSRGALPVYRFGPASIGPPWQKNPKEAPGRQNATCRQVREGKRGGDAEGRGESRSPASPEGQGQGPGEDGAPGVCPGVRRHRQGSPRAPRQRRDDGLAPARYFRKRVLHEEPAPPWLRQPCQGAPHDW